MTHRFRVSVVVPAFNPGSRLVEALDSVFSQERVIPEVIVVNDGSEEDLEPVLKPVRSRLRYVERPHRGPAAARNTGVELAREPCVTFLDADDTWSSNGLVHAVESLQGRPELAGAHCLTQVMVERDDERGRTWQAFGVPWRSPQLGSIVVRREVAQRLRFDETLAQGEDFDWFVRLREAGTRIATLDEVMLLYRIHDRNLTLGCGPAERNTFLILKRALDRRRSRRGVVSAVSVADPPAAGGPEGAQTPHAPT